MAMERLLALMAKKKASDMFIAAGTAVQIKINGTTVPINQQRLDPPTIESLLREVLTDRQWAQFEHDSELNFGYGLHEVGSFRFSLFKQRGTPAAVVRYIPGDVPPFESLNLPPVLSELIMEKRGLLLVVGSTGSGKTTTLASLLDHRNTHRSGHILTLEDPIEFTFRHKRAVVNQRQIGTDAVSLGIALKNALRQAPDCLMIGEIRDVETMSAAIAYAQSGHLVLSTLHANNASHALTRILSFYTPDNRRALLADLATTLRGVVSQRLIRSAAGGRLPVVEILLNTTFVAELIEQGRLSEVKEAMEKSMAPGSQTFERALVDLVRANKVSKEDALAQSDSPTNLLWLLENTKDAGAEGAPPPLRGPEPPSAAEGQKATEGPTFSEFMLNI
ncbi:MAG: PilT/PilU family type 4a pilus ATPase [Burkholderiales bacterium]